MPRKNNIHLTNEYYKELANSFYTHLIELGYNPKSNKTRYYNLCEFLYWLELQNKQDLHKIKSIHIQTYYHYLGTRPNKNNTGLLSPKTIHSHMRMVKDFFIMLQQQGTIKTNPCSALYFPYPKENTAARQILTQKEIRLLYQSAESHRERAILSLAYGCGLRAGEMQNCNLTDVHFREKILIVPKGKGNKRRIVPLSKGVIKDLLDYYHNDREELKRHKNCKSTETAFMLNDKGKRMMLYTFNKYLKRIIERTGNDKLMVKPITIHNLRHSIATHLLEQGIKVEQVRLFLGHSQLETTQIYTHISNKMLQQLQITSYKLRE
jgi:integrase/recombinase XerD